MGLTGRGKGQGVPNKTNRRRWERISDRRRMFDKMLRVEEQKKWKVRYRPKPDWAPEFPDYNPRTVGPEYRKVEDDGSDPWG